MTKQELKDLRKAIGEIDQLLNEMECLNTKMTSPKIPSLSGMPYSQPATSDQMAENVCKYLTLATIYQSRLSTILEAQAALETAMDCLDPIERQIVRAYYLRRHNWEEVCVAVNYEWAQTHRKHASALRKLAAKDDIE